MAKIAIKYQFAAVATDMAILTVIKGRLNILLMKMNKKPYLGFWAVPGGLVKPKESIDEAAKRILAAKGGLKNVYLEQVHTFGQVNRDPFGRVVSVAYYALIPSSGLHLKTKAEDQAVKWFPVKHLPKLAYDHATIVKKITEHLKDKISHSNVVYSLLPEAFTLTELQKIYEIISNRTLDKRNFRKKILALGLISKSGQQLRGQANRPAELYHFLRRTPKNVNII